MNPSMARKPQQTNGDVKQQLSKLGGLFRDADFETYIKNGDTLILTDAESVPRTDSAMAIRAVERSVDIILRSSGIKGAHRQHSLTVQSSNQYEVLIQVYIQIHPAGGYDS